jgi:hypothetical protein
MPVQQKRENATERIGDVILLGKQHTLQAGDRLVVGVNAYGQA